MTEDMKHQLDELTASDIQSYLGARVSSMEEHIRRGNKQLTKVKEIIRDLLSCLYSVEYNRISDLEEAEQFLKEVSE